METSMERTYGKEYGVKPDAVIDISDKPGVNDPAISTHRHVVVKWDGGEVWLDMSVQSDHFCVDVRQFNDLDEMKGQGVFGMVNGHRQSLGEASVYATDEDRWLTTKQEPLEDTNGTPVTGHGWNGSYVITLMTDLHGREAAAILPSQGNG